MVCSDMLLRSTPLCRKTLHSVVLGIIIMSNYSSHHSTQEVCQTFYRTLTTSCYALALAIVTLLVTRDEEDAQEVVDLRHSQRIGSVKVTVNARAHSRLATKTASIKLSEPVSRYESLLAQKQSFPAGNSVSPGDSVSERSHFHQNRIFKWEQLRCTPSRECQHPVVTTVMNNIDRNGQKIIHQEG